MRNVKFILPITIIIVSIVFLLFKENSSSNLTIQGWSDKEIKITILNPFSNKKKSSSVYLVVGWDIMLSRNIGLAWKQDWYDRIFWSWQFNPINDFWKCNSKDCILFFNLESLFYHPDNDIKMWWFMFRANTGNIDTLLQLKWDKELILSLANNHTINWWYKGINMTRKLLDENDIQHIWAGLDPYESREINVIKKNNIKICSQAYSYDGQYVKVWEWKISWNNLNEKDIIEDIQNMKYLDCDAKIVYLHWWSEYKIKPNQGQKILATNLIDAWVDLIIWWHSHVPWIFTKINDKYVFYSFWNFIFDQDWGKNTILPNVDYVYDHSLGRHTVPTYISLLWWFEITKNSSWTEINFDKMVMSKTTKWLHNRLDDQTYQEIYDKINNIE